LPRTDWIAGDDEIPIRHALPAGRMMQEFGRTNRNARRISEEGSTKTESLSFLLRKLWTPLSRLHDQCAGVGHQNVGHRSKYNFREARSFSGQGKFVSGAWVKVQRYPIHIHSITRFL